MYETVQNTHRNFVFLNTVMVLEFGMNASVLFFLMFSMEPCLAAIQEPVVVVKPGKCLN